MSYRNSMKLLASNFVLVWKQVVYMLVCFLIFLLCSYNLLKPVLSVFDGTNIGERIGNIINVILNSPADFAVYLLDLVKDILSLIATNFSVLYANLIGLMLTGLILPYVMIQVAIFNLSNIVYKKSTMNMNIKFSSALISSFGDGLKYALSNLIFNIPFVILTTLPFVVYLFVVKSAIWALLGLVFISAFNMFVYSIKIVIFAHYTGILIDTDLGTFKAYGKAYSLVFKNFWKNISSSLVLYLTIIFINSFIMVFTFFAGLIVSIPATIVLLAIYFVVSYLNLSGKRYYLTDSIIYNPVKYTVKKDDFVTISVPENAVEEEIVNKKMKRKK